MDVQALHGRDVEETDDLDGIARELLVVGDVEAVAFEPEARQRARQAEAGKADHRAAHVSRLARGAEDARQVSIVLRPEIVVHHEPHDTAHAGTRALDTTRGTEPKNIV